ncbi:unnamed protein product [Ectocarpus sp. 4 AP-2014]
MRLGARPTRSHGCCYTRKTIHNRIRRAGRVRGIADREERRSTLFNLGVCFGCVRRRCGVRHMPHRSLCSTAAHRRQCPPYLLVLARLLHLLHVTSVKEVRCRRVVAVTVPAIIGALVSSTW